jgi:5'-AMP-activated protein kinase catalytic alpha subunit
MIAGKRYDGLKTDIWSCGIILFAMVCGYLPFEDPKTQDLYKKILSANYSIPKFTTVDGKELIKGVLNTNPDKRFTIDDIKSSNWFN